MLLPFLYFHACAISAHAHVSIVASTNSHLWLAAKSLTLAGAGTVYSDILVLIVLHANMTSRTKDLARYRVS